MKQFHPLVLILLALLLSSLAIIIASPASLAGVFVVAAVLRAWLSGASPKAWLREAKRLLPLFLAVMAVQLLFNKSGNAIWGWGLLSVHDAALAKGLAFCLRMLVLYYSASLLIRLSYDDFDLAFGALRCPEELGFMIFYTLHVIPMAGAEIRRSLELLRLRGIDLPKTSLKIKLRIYKRISLTLLADVLSRSAIQATALDLRGFRSSGPRTRLLKRAFRIPDMLLAVAAISVFILLIILSS